MKAIGIKMVELQPMRASIALSTGYKIGNAHPDDMGYEVTYPDGYKSWTPKLGDMIARNPKNHKDQWLVAKEYFNDNFEELI